MKITWIEGFNAVLFLQCSDWVSSNSGSRGSWHLSIDCPTELRTQACSASQSSENVALLGGEKGKTMQDCLPTTSLIHPFVKMNLQSCCICVRCGVSTVGTVYSPISCGCFTCTDLARGEVSIWKSFFWALGGWFSSYTGLCLPCSWTWQTSLE